MSRAKAKAEPTLTLAERRGGRTVALVFGGQVVATFARSAGPGLVLVRSPEFRGPKARTILAEAVNMLHARGKLTVARAAPSSRVRRVRQMESDDAPITLRSVEMVAS